MKSVSFTPASLRIACLAFLVIITSLSARALTAESPRCEALNRPLGIDVIQPRLSWRLESSERGARQTAYRLLVASSPQILAKDKGDLWDSGRVTSAETFGIVYAGQPLASDEQCFWKVKVWDQDNRESPWCLPALWTMGLLKPSDWQATWIGFDEARAALAPPTKETPVILPPPVQLRTVFSADKTVASATLHVAALGLADVYLNGRRVSDDEFASGWTDYAKRVYARTYDVTAGIRSGNNAIGAILADGWYSGYVGYKSQRDHYGKHPRVRLQLDLVYADGSHATVATGPSWKAATGALIEADFLKGERFDARRLDAWSEPTYDDRTWSPVVSGAEVSPVVQSHPGPPVVAFSELKAKTITEPAPGAYILDFGQNFAGVARLKLADTVPGQQITLRYGERLNPDGTLYTKNLRSARATDTYFCRGDGGETWQPRFTYHGFQYIEVTGLAHKPDADTVTGVALSSDTPVAGDFSSSNPLLNKLHENIVWTQRMNFIDIPTDCPQRDERLGWTGDAQIYIRTASLNTDIQAFFTKWLVDLADAQRSDGQFPMVAPLKVAGGDGGPAWADAGVVCPWTIYDVYGDRRILETHYEGMTRFIAFCQKRCQPGLLPPDKFHCFGDWLSINAKTPSDVIYLAYFALSTRLTAQTAAVLGKTEDAAKYQALFEQIKTAFNQAYVSADGHIKGDTQTAYVLAIVNDLLDADKTQLAAKYLVENIEARGGHLSTGFIGTKDLMLALAKIGRNDVAYRLAVNTTFPSWGFSIKQGATSIWERWNGWTPDKGFGDAGMNSFAHYSFGAIYQWMMENIGGIRTDGPAYHRILIAPQPGGDLTQATTRYDSVRGPIETRWSLHDGQFDLDVTIPPNTTATVRLPASDASSVNEGGRPAAHSPGITFLRTEKDVVVYSILSGRYTFSSKP